MQGAVRPRIFLSYSRDSEKHDARVLSLAERLIAAGCDCMLDQYEHPSEGWPQWMDRQLDEANFVLVVCTEDYYRKSKSKPQRAGRGVRFESVLIVQELYDAGMMNAQFIPVLFDELADDLILRPLRGFTRYRVDQREGFEDLLRHLTGQPRYVRPAPGPIPTLPRDSPSAAAPLANCHYRTTDGRSPVQERMHEEGAGPGPQLHNLPFPSLGELFQGRENELAEMERALAPQDKEKAPLREMVLHGLGGIGKTQLAVEYAWRVGHQYRSVFFLRSDSAQGLQAELASLAGAELLDLPARRERAEGEVVGAVLRWLRENPGWLLIVDNADTRDGARAVVEWLPRLQGGQVVVTSRIAVWPAGVETREVLRISSTSAAQFLLERTAGARQASGDDAAVAEELARSLDGLPLALEQAAAYIRYHRITLHQYLMDWEKGGMLLGWYEPLAMRYPRSLAATWQTTIERLGPAARALLRLAAHLAADPIPVEMFAMGAKILDAAVDLCRREDGSARPDEVTPAAAIAELAAHSMLERGEYGLSVHRLVQEVTRARIPKETSRTWADLTVRLVYGYAPVESMDVRTWPVWNVLRSHASAAIDHADRAAVREPTCGLATELGLLLFCKGLDQDAEPLLRRALDLAERLHGAEHPAVAVGLTNLALLFEETNRLAEAEPLMHRALAIDKAASGPQHPDVARDLGNLAGLFLKTNRSAEAEPLMRQAFAIRWATHGPQHPEVATALNNLALCLRATIRLAEAEPLMRQALAIDEVAYGPEHPNVARDLNNLSLLLFQSNRDADAESLNRRALAIDEAAYGPEHPTVADELHNLALLLLATNRLTEAKPLMQRSVAIVEALYGPDDPRVITKRTIVASWLR